MNLHWNVVVALVVASCGAAPAQQSTVEVAATPANAAEPTVTQVPGAVYAKLFELGTTWKFDVTWKVHEFDETATGKEQASCSIVSVETLGQATTSQMKCVRQDAAEDTGYSSWFSCNFAKTAAGLWISGVPITPETFTESGMVLAATPVENKESYDSPGGDWGWNVESKQNANGDWCFSENTWSGDGSTTSLCLNEETGIVSGEEVGGSSSADISATISLAK